MGHAIKFCLSGFTFQEMILHHSYNIKANMKSNFIKGKSVLYWASLGNGDIKFQDIVCFLVESKGTAELPHL